MRKTILIAAALALFSSAGMAQSTDTKGPATTGPAAQSDNMSKGDMTKDKMSKKKMAKSKSTKMKKTDDKNFAANTKAVFGRSFCLVRLNLNVQIELLM